MSSARAPIVETVAKQMHAAGSRPGETWEGLSPLQQLLVLQKVEDVLLAALLAGYVLTRAASLEPKKSVD